MTQFYFYFARPIMVAAVLISAEPVFGAEFFPLPQLPGSTQAGDAFAVSADGTTVVGTSHDGNAFQAVRWTIGPVITIETLGAGDFSFARGVSADGSTVVGYRAFPGGQAAFRWTERNGLIELGDLPGGDLVSRALGVSADGNTVVGMSISSEGGEAFRWTNATGLVSIGDLAGGGVGGEAFATSADGTVIVGSGLSDSGTEAFRWTDDSGIAGLGDLPAFGFFSEAYGVSADGSVVVGSSAGGAFPFSFRAFRWTIETGMVALPDVPSVGPTARAEGISGDGNVIVGTADDGILGQAMVWDDAHGSRELDDLLTSQGADLTGWRLQVARSASYDGFTIAGLGINPEGLQQPWMARVNPGTFIPEPCAGLLSLGGLIVILGARILRRQFSRLR